MKSILGLLLAISLVFASCGSGATTETECQPQDTTVVVSDTLTDSIQ
jgi:hypothetical protein